MPSTRLSSTFVRFLLIGVLNSAVGLGGIAFGQFFLGWSYLYANILGYSLGLINSFFWNKFWTFESSSWRRGEPVRFLTVFLLSYLAQLGLVSFLVTSVGAPEFPSQAAGICTYTAINYSLNKHWTFRKKM